MFVIFAFWGFLSSHELEVGTSTSMGPGYFPRILSGLLLAFGSVIIAVGRLNPSTSQSDADFSTSPSVDWSIRPLVFVSVAALSFALLLQRAGIVVAISVTVLLGCLAGERPRPIEMLILAAMLIIGCIALFVWGIGIPLPIWPRWGDE
jgi:Tripartite tricarboxylate transporter TctB family